MARSEPLANAEMFGNIRHASKPLKKPKQTGPAQLS